MAKGNSSKTKQRAVSSTELLRLYHWNRRFAVAYLIEGAILYILSAARSLPVTVNYLAVDPISSTVAGHTVLSTATRQLCNISLPGLLAILFLIGLVTHSVSASFYRKRYEAEVRQGMSRARWLEFGVSLGVILVLIGLLSGIYDLVTLIAVLGLSIIAGLLGLTSEFNRQSRKLAYIGGVVALLVLWLIIALYVFNATYYGSAHIPTYVYWIYGTMLVCIIGFGVNAYFEHKQRGKWSNYAYSEWIFMLLGFVTKSLLAWQIFAGVLRP